MLPPGVHPPEALSSDAVGRIVSRMNREGVEIEGPLISGPDS